ncbi:MULTISPECIES: sulfatase [unclassified Lentimonas]|uniref:sulfatase n=1 Tax=unclassified Lentimonas TaxID=2630993 RepID=UPI001FCFAEF9|nr:MULTISPECIES: sulfatase [unclassified Lentimonas]
MLKRSILILLAAVSTSVASTRPAQPNILLLLTDDLGWQDVKCYDIDEPSPYETPNIDALAKKGVMFWQGYSPAPTCAPSRCAIMSGNHPARAHKTHVVGGHPPYALNKNRATMDPWYSGRMPADEFTLARALKQEGYVTGHSGKWHIAIDHHAFPQPEDVGFDYTRSSRGAHSGMKNRLSGFATDAADDPFRLDENGFPFHQTNDDALTFIKENKDKPFFLYYATWLVHSPMVTRNEALLQKYVDKMGADPEHVLKREDAGQLNPFYGAMVESLDYYVGQVFKYLETTEDPRWPGHMLSENTFIIFTSDNGGMEGGPKERYTDNNPLDRGKISAKEGGTRVPLIIVGPNIPAGVQTDVMANGLDFYPTILSMVGAEKPEGKNLDGLDLLPLLTQDPTDPTLVKEADGSVRDTMMWHFPHGYAMESTVRVGDYKLIRKYDALLNPEPLELYRLYDSSNGSQERVDIEEAKSLAKAMPEKTQEMNRLLTGMLTEMDASLPGKNPNCAQALPNKDRVPVVLETKQQGAMVGVRYEEHGAKVIRADLIYTLNGAQKYEEWFRAPAELIGNGKVLVQLPEGTTHYFINLTDENGFLISYPEITSRKTPFDQVALTVTK